jgi:hypothetical protein
MKNGSYFPGRGTLVEETFLEGKAEGKAEGLAKGALRVLLRQQVVVTDDARERITACQDIPTLELWTDRAFDVATIDELFEEPTR